jgi:hypothetical protein
MPTPIQSSVQSTTLKPADSQQAQAGNVVKLDQVEVKAQLNISIIQASVQVSISAKNEPMQLLYKTVLDKLNELLKPQLGENAIQNAVSQDNTPEGTASRIVSLSTGFLEAFKAQHPGEDQTAVVNHFVETIRKGIDQGFKEARDILQGLGVLQGDIASNIDKTYALVQQQLDAFLSSMLASTAEVQTA